MLEEIIKEQRELQIDSIGRLLQLSNFLINNNTEPTEKVEENCLVDTAKVNLERSRLIHDLIINISEIIKGGK